MRNCWSDYEKTRDIKYLINAVESAPFFGQSEMAVEIGRLLRNMRITKRWRRL